jgi:hypothetical protein
MFQTYLGLAPGEAPIDRLVDGVLPDPADRVIGDPLTGAVIAAVPPVGGDLPARDGHDSLWRRLRVRWTRAAIAAG